MGVIERILGIGQASGQVGQAIEGVAEVFTVNKTKAELAFQQRAGQTVSQYGAEFQTPVSGFFDGFINGLNRLPRPTLAFGTIGLFVYAMVHPAGFSVRMQGLAYVPEPLWWLLGAVVSFYFGARELHYKRQALPIDEANVLPEATEDTDNNAALDEWRAQV